MDDSGLVLFVGDLTFQGEVVLFEAMKMETVKKKKTTDSELATSKCKQSCKVKWVHLKCGHEAYLL